MLVAESTFDKIKDYERSDELSDRQKATLRLADAYMMEPRLGTELRVQVFEHFTPEQVVVLTLKSVNYTSQKILVALGVDLPYDGPGVEKTPEGFNMIDHPRYVEALAGDEIYLPVEQRVSSQRGVG